MVDAHATEQQDSGVPSQRSSRLSWNVELTDEVTLDLIDERVFQRRSVSFVGSPEGGDAPGSPKTAGILKRALDECNQEPANNQVRRFQKLERLLERQVREEEEQVKPLKIDVGATLNNVWGAIFVSPLLDLVDKLKVSKGEADETFNY